MPDRDDPKISCPHCGKQYRWKADYAGRSVKCKDCEQVFEFPAKPTDPDTLSGLSGSHGPVGLDAADLSGSRSSAGHMSTIAPSSEAAMATADTYEMQGSGSFDDLIQEAKNNAELSSKVCPNCRAVCDPSAMICVHCGYNYQTGVVLDVDIHAEEEAEKSRGVFSSRKQKSSESTPLLAPPRNDPDDEKSSSASLLSGDTGYHVRQTATAIVIMIVGVMLYFYSSAEAIRYEIEENQRLTEEYTATYLTSPTDAYAKPATPVNLKTLDGSTWTFRDHSPGKMIVFEIFDIEQRLAFARFAAVTKGVERFRSTSPESEIQIVYVARQDDPEAVQAYLDETVQPYLAKEGVTLDGPILLSNEAFYEAYIDDYNFPYLTVIVDDDGTKHLPIGDHATGKHRQEYPYKLNAKLSQADGAQAKRLAEEAELQAQLDAVHSDAASQTRLAVFGRLIFGIPLAIALMFGFAQWMMVSFGSLPLAIPRVAAIYLFPPAIGGLLALWTEQAVDPFLGLFVFLLVASAFYYGLIWWFFELDFVETAIFGVSLLILNWFAGFIGILVLYTVLT